MVDREQRLAGGKGQRLAGHQPDHHPADQPRPRRCRHRIDIGEPHPGLGQHVRHHRRQPVDMGARRQFGHDAAEGAMRFVLRRDALARDAAVTVHQRHGGFIAGRFDTKDEHAPPLAGTQRGVDSAPVVVPVAIADVTGLRYSFIPVILPPFRSKRST